METSVYANITCTDMNNGSTQCKIVIKSHYKDCYGLPCIRGRTFTCDNKSVELLCRLVQAELTNDCIQAVLDSNPIEV